MKRFIKRILSMLVATIVCVISLTPVLADRIEETDSFSNYLKENNYHFTNIQQRCDVNMSYSNGTIIVTIANPTSDYKVECSLYGKNRDIPASVGTPVKFILPDRTTYDDFVNTGGHFKFIHRPDMKNKFYDGYDENGNATGASCRTGDILYQVLYGHITVNEPVTENGNLFTWETLENFITGFTNWWHYDPNSSWSVTNTPPNDLDRVLNAAKGTRYESLIVEWVNKVKQETGSTTETITTEPVAEPQRFVDVTTAHWANKNIKKMADLGVISGYEDGTFRPENQISHEEFIKIVMSLLKYSLKPLPEGYKVVNIKNPDTDDYWTNRWVDWAQQYLNAAMDAGIVKRFEDTDLIVPNTPITRAEMAKVISRTLAYLGYQDDTNNDLSGVIADWNDISDEYKPYVAHAYTAGILTGYEDGTFRPDNTLTRAEVSSVVVNIIDK